MSAYILTPGATGPSGTGISLLSWRNGRCVVVSDAPGTLRYLEVYCGRIGSAASTAAGGRSNFKAPFTGTLKNFAVKFAVAPPVTITFVVYVAGAPTSITVTVSGTTAVADTTHTAAVTQGQSVQVVASFASGTPTNTTTTPQATLTLV